MAYSFLKKGCDPIMVLVRPTDSWITRLFFEESDDSSAYCLVFLKLYEKIHAPLTAGILRPFAADHDIPQEKITAIDRRYSAVIHALDDLLDAVGLKAA